MKSNDETISFKNREDAEILLKESRERIDEIDNALFDLISQRTALAKDIVFSKDYLGLPIYDESREKAIHKKVEKLAKENNLDCEIIVCASRTKGSTVDAVEDVAQRGGYVTIWFSPFYSADSVNTNVLNNLTADAVIELIRKCLMH